MPKVLLFDIDRTLIDSDLLKTNWNKLAKIRLGIKPENFMPLLSSYTSALARSTDFTPKGFANYISLKTNTDKGEILKLLLDKKLFKACLFPETKWVLKRVQKTYTLGIFSEGFNSYQKQKLTLSGIYNFFNTKKIFIFRRKLMIKNINKLPKDAIVIDDNYIVTKKLRSKNIRAIWVNRKKVKSNFRYINSLKELTDEVNIKKQQGRYKRK